MQTKSEEYHERAATLKKFAEETRDEVVRKNLLRLAEEYEEMADKAHPRK